MKSILIILSFLSTLGTLTFSDVPAYACGGWWDPCCPWFDPDRCAAFEANKRQKAAENEAYFARQEDRLRMLARVLNLIPGAGLGAQAANAGADAARKAKEANAKVARGGTGASEAADYYEYYWPDHLANYDGVYVEAWGNYIGAHVDAYRNCMQDGGEWACQPYKDAAVNGLHGLGWWLDTMSGTLNIVAWEVEAYAPPTNEGSEVINILRDMANASYYAGQEYLQ